MIDSRITGAYIAHLRHAKDWTQLELADNLNVTHQAVSRWEKGDSFPDISVLSNIAKLFGVSVDDLLNGGPGAPRRPGGRATTADVLTALAQGDAGGVARKIRDQQADVETFIDAAQVARPSQVDAVMQELKGIKLSAEQIVELAPFVGKDVLRSLVLTMTPEEADQGLLSSLAPFLGRETMDELVRRVVNGEMESSTLAELAPFLSRETLDSLVDRVSEGKIDADTLEELAPFLSRDSLSRLVEKIGQGTLTVENMVALAPFMPKEALDRMVDRMAAGEVEAEHLEELAPFLSRATLAKLLRMTADGKLDAHTIVSLSPFLDRETLEALIRGSRGQE